MERISIDNPYKVSKVYPYKSKILLIMLMEFYSCQISYEKYNENGKLIEETSDDKKFKFSINDLIEKVKKEYQVEFDTKQIYITSEDITHRGGVTIKYKLWGKRVLSNHYDKIPLDYMFQLSKQFDTKYLEHKILKNKIEDEHILKISSQLFNYVDACQSLRNNYIKKSNNGENISPSDYVTTVDNYYYRNFKINIEDLKILRNRFLHWSANLNAFGMSPRVSGIHKEKERKRTILDG